MTGFHSAGVAEGGRAIPVVEVAPGAGVELVVGGLAGSTSDAVVEVLTDNAVKVVVGPVGAVVGAVVAATGSSPPWLTTIGAPAPQPPMSRLSTTAPITA